MNKDEKEIKSIAKEIERYLSMHNSAADTLEGVATWWLTSQRYHEAPENVQKALNYLVRTGRIVRTRNADGTDLYSKTRQ